VQKEERGEQVRFDWGARWRPEKQRSCWPGIFWMLRSNWKECWPILTLQLRLKILNMRLVSNRRVCCHWRGNVFWFSFRHRPSATRLNEEQTSTQPGVERRQPGRFEMRHWRTRLSSSSSWASNRRALRVGSFGHQGSWKRRCDSCVTPRSSNRSSNRHRISHHRINRSNRLLRMQVQ